MQNEIMERRHFTFRGLLKTATPRLSARQRLSSQRPPLWRLALLCGLLAVSIAVLIGFGPDSTAPTTFVAAATPQSTAQAASTPAHTNRAPGAPAGAIILAPTAHPPIPKTADELWLVPAAAQNATRTVLMTRFSEGVDAIARSDYAEALPKVNDARLAKTPIADYASYYTALARLHTGRFAEARNDFNALNAARPAGVLREWGLLGEAAAAEALGQYADAARLYEMASMLKTSAPDAVLNGMARTLAAAGDKPRALTAYRRVYYEFPLSELSDGARGQILQLTGIDETSRLRQDFALELGRAQRLFGSKRYAESLTAFEALRPLAEDDNRELVGLRIAEAQFYLGRYRQAIDAARPFLNGSRKAEARFFSLSATRGLGDHAAYVNEARRLVEQFPNDAWAEETLNNLGTHYILIDEDDTALTVFRDYLTRFPNGRYTQRAAWKVGWAAYRQQKYQDTITVFEQAAANFPRSDYRPPYLYWTARAYDQLDKSDATPSTISTRITAGSPIRNCASAELPALRSGAHSWKSRSWGSRHPHRRTPWPCLHPHRRRPTARLPHRMPAWLLPPPPHQPPVKRLAPRLLPRPRPLPRRGRARPRRPSRCRASSMHASVS